MGGNDLTTQCLRDVREKFGSLRNQARRDFEVVDLRDIFCADCRNPECEYALLSVNPWEDRMATQVSRLLENPRFGDALDPRWSHLQGMDFRDLMREVIRVQLADQRGDWSVPTQREVDAAMGDIGSPEREDPAVEAAVQNMPRLHTVIQIHSKTQPGVTYDVTVDENGRAVACSCNAGKYGRRCTHRVWAEQEFQRRQEMPPRDTLPEAPVSPSEASQPGGSEESLPLLGVQQDLSGSLRGPYSGLAGNTPLPSQGVLLEGAPADGLRRISKDPWAAPVKSATPVSPSGVKITIGGKKDE